MHASNDTGPLTETALSQLWTDSDLVTPSGAHPPLPNLGSAARRSLEIARALRRVGDNDAVWRVNDLPSTALVHSLDRRRLTTFLFGHGSL